MKLVARHADGTKSEWQMETNDHIDAIETVSSVITAETGAPPKAVLALIEKGKHD